MASAPPGYSVFREYDAVVAESIITIDGDILWCDITRGLIRRSTPGSPVDGSADTVLQLPIPVCSFHPAHSGFVASLADRVILADPAGRVLRTLAAIHHASTRMRLNEGKVDPAGRWITGSMELTNSAPIGAFYAVTPNGDLRELIGGIGTANGLEWSPDGTKIYFTDTSIDTIFVGTYTTDGDINNVDVFHRGAPHDGLVIDSDGNFWGAIFGEGRVIHLDPDGHEITSITLPAPNLTSVAFHANTLYVASAREKLSPQQLRDHPLSGSVFAIETQTTGPKVRTFDA